MFRLECDHIPERYPEVLRLALDEGRRVEPRGQKCLEITPLCVSASYPRKRLFGTPGRNENPIFPYIEGLWVLRGDDSPEMLSHYVRQTLCYVNPQTGRFDGAYGPRIRNGRGLDQLDAVYRRLQKDRHSRRAVMTIFDPIRDNDEDSLDVPCTISWQFMIRDDKLEMITYMRSNDLFRGFVYDTIEFQWFQEILAGWLGVDVGTYFHIVGSAHVYLTDKPRIDEILVNCQRSIQPFSLYAIHSPQDARLPKQTFEKEMRTLAETEERSRRGLLLHEDTVNEIMHVFRSGFYRNLALAIAGFNAQRYGEREISTKLLSLIDNELGFLMRREARRPRLAKAYSATVGVTA